MEPKGPEWLGLELIRASGMKRKGKNALSSRWRGWVSWCAEAGVSALAATGDDAVGWLRHEERKAWMVKETKKAVSLVYRALGMASPFAERRAMREVFGGNGRYGAEEEYSDFSRECHGHRVRDYLGWCQQGGRAALPGSGRQVAEFLLALAKDYSYSMVEQASAGVSRYLEDNECPGTSRHPAVQKAMKECQVMCSGRVGPGHRELRVKTTTRRDVMQDHWTEWCQAQGQGKGWKCAGVDDALRYLRELEYQRTAGLRVHQLSLLYEGMEENPFSSEAVLDWRSEHALWVKEKPAVDWRVVSRAEEVIQEMRAARAAQPVKVAVGLSLEEVADLNDDLSDNFAASTLRGYSQSFAGFERWLGGKKVDGKKLALHQVVDQHVAAYLKHKSRNCRVTTLRSIASGLAMVFEEMKNALGLEENPVLTGLVDSYLAKLQRRRRERAAQMDPIREEHYQAVMTSVRMALVGERTGRAELRSALVVALFSVMFDGMLRAGEAQEALWEDVSRRPDGSGRLYVPLSKTDQDGIGEYVYLSPRSMVALDHLREVRRKQVVVKAKDDRIFQIGPSAMRVMVLEACKAAGLEGRFGTHSFRIGMAQELVLAGFGLVLIMRAGRWDSPEMPAYYIRGLDVDKMAVAELHRVWAQGGDRAIGEARGIDVLSTYDFVRTAG